MPGPLFYRQIRKKQIDGWMKETRQNKTEEQQLRLLGDNLKPMKLEELIKTDG